MGAPYSTVRECSTEPAGDAELPENTPEVVKPKRRRRASGIPAGLRQETAVFARGISKRYRDAFNSDRTLKEKTLRYARALLPPKPRRRGRPFNQETTRAIVLYNRFRRQHPQEKPREIWDHVCLVLYSEYAGLPEIERHDIRDALRGRVKSRVRSRRVRKSR